MASASDHVGAEPAKEASGSAALATRAIHGDDKVTAVMTDIAPPIHVATTFRYPDDPDKLVPTWQNNFFKDGVTPPEKYNYSRFAAPNSTRFETILSSVLEGYALTYASGLAAYHALLVYLKPKVIAIGDGYHGTHGVVAIHSRLTGLKKVNLLDEASWDAAGLGKGDVVHVETPLNPTGEAVNLTHYAELAHKRGAYLTVDATFGPPGLQDPFKHGVDVVQHSGTKYLGGHDDMLCGVLAVRRLDLWKGLYLDRSIIGGVLGSLEGWLGVRSMRTLALRVQRQSENAGNLVAWLDASLRGQSEDSEVVQATVLKVQHASLQLQDMHWLKKQMPNGFGPVFALWMKTPAMAKRLPSKLRLFHHATSLGGVESLIEWRSMSDSNIDERLLRVSVGVEAWEDLKADFIDAFRASRVHDT